MTQRVASPMGFDEFLLGFLSCAVLSVTAISLYVKNRRREESRLKQTIAVEILRNLNVAKLRKLLGDMDVPAWITYSDFERAEWLSQLVVLANYLKKLPSFGAKLPQPPNGCSGYLSKLMDKVWPYVDNAVSAVARAKLEPKLKERRAAWMADITLEHFTLGTKAPMVTGVKLYHSSTGGISETASMDIDFLWGGNQARPLILNTFEWSSEWNTCIRDVSLVIKPLPFFLNVALGLAQFINIQAITLYILFQSVGVERVIVSGRVRVLLRPLMDTLPIIGAVQVAFADMPSFRFDLRLLGGDVTSLPFLEDWLQNVLCSFLEHYTLPNKVSAEIVKGVLAQVERPVGILTVRLIEAENIPRIDFCSESDPYVVLYIRPHRRLQSTIKNNRRHPVWNECFRLLVHEPDQDTLTCLLYDYDHVRADTLVGRVDWPVSEIHPGQERDLWVEVQPPHCAKSKAGSPDRPQGSSPGQLPGPRRQALISSFL
ncbi:hypothetical protein COCSUDRAFT_63427 [Coccomyxa subellipsoidea C-169]|uniref:C2 domain-containing protein n=1 Tax=Coccomyxa subellipsoidea (strain C-169) TaxID=574566 RepID=I0YXC6_COCSC|nr:hypothetical protein COCSUDRAFT_63427 [Coccomyxa subellipsoidea C-169]EIE23045.1 hypothetical protein COCSUDRAFT_63427 [Coccomyxa subellipsoidea C-169]|eukprot:XP_005647589.1 hypothetical protein COCSUDRAFT_63427 [Coccomyxa subellipsoidea C-169]